MYRNHWVTSDVQFRKGAWTPPFLGGRWLTWLKDRCWGGKCLKRPKNGLKGKFCNRIIQPDLFNTVKYQRGDIEAQNGYGLCMLLGQVALTGTFQAQLWYVGFQRSWARNVQVRGPIPNRPRREPYFLDSHMLYLTSQRTKPGDFLCFEILMIW